MIGLLTPPVGMVLYVLSRVSGISFERCTSATMPFLFPLVVVLALITFVPGFSMWPADPDLPVNNYLTGAHNEGGRL